MSQPLESTIPRLVLGAAERYGDATAVEDGETRLSFRELADRGLAAARAYLAHGIEPGDRVALWAPNVYEWIVACIGAQMAGGIAVTLNTRMKGAEAAQNLRKSRARLLCTMGEFLGVDYAGQLSGQELPDLEQTLTFRGVGADTRAWEEFLAAGEGVSEETARDRALSVSPDDLCDFIFTSGTTGAPKAAMTAHGQNVRVFDEWSRTVGLREGDRYLIINPFFHSFGYKAGWLSCVIRGATAIPQAVFDAEEALRRVSAERISVLPGPPAIYQSFLATPDLADYDTTHLRLAVTGAAPVPVELVERMKTELGFETVVTAYGLTESCGVVSICRPDDPPEVISHTSGCALPDTEVRCVDAKGEEVPRGSEGEVWVRGYNVMRGYFDDEEQTRETIDEDGWLHTGDVAVMDERGYLNITDRIKDMYISGGFNCYPAEVEGLMFGSGLFAQVAVIGVSDERMGEVGMAFVVPAPGKSLDRDEVVAWCRQNMANYKVPRRVAVVDELPLNASGKVMKFMLRERAESGEGA